MSFLGNPNVAIAAIDVSGGIAMPRTSGQLPFFVHVSASAFTATGAASPYEDLDFRWDFGDPSGTETFIRPTDGVTINANNRQIGPEAAYVYRIAGTYTITCYVTGKNGSGIVSAVQTQSVTASAFDKSGGEYWFDSVNGLDTNTGLSSAAPKQTLSALNLLITNAHQHTAIHVKRGSSYDGGALPLNLWNGNGATCVGLRIDAYGSGANPIFISTTAAAPALNCTNGGSSSGTNKSDIVLSNIDFTTSGAQTGAQVLIAATSNASATISYVYLDNCNVSTTSNDVAGTVFQVEFDGGALFPTGAGLWNCNLKGLTTIPVNSSNNGFYGGARKWTFILGGSIAGNTKDTAVSGGLDCHHIYPEIQEHPLYAYIAFGTGIHRSYCINGNWNSVSGDLETVQWTNVRDNSLSGTALAIDAGQSNSAGLTFTNGLADVAVPVPFQGIQPSVGTQIILANKTGSPPTNFGTGIRYFVTSVTGSPTVTSIQLSATSGGTAIVAGSAGTGATAALRTVYKNSVVERNAFNGLTGGVMLTLLDNSETVTLRDNRVWNCKGGQWLAMNGSMPAFDKLRAYRNKVFYPSDAAAGTPIFYMAWPLLTGAQQITDNEIVDARSNAAAIAIPFAAQPAAGTIIDRNSYSNPGLDTTFLFDNATAKTFAQWQTQGFDANGTNLVGAKPLNWKTISPTSWSDFETGKRSMVIKA